MSIGRLLRDYGVVALGFHFTVWLLTVSTVFAAVSLAGSDLLAHLPSWLPVDAGAGAGAGAGKIAVTLGVVEVIGPARLALTVAATPTVSARVRKTPLGRLVVRRAQVALGSALERVQVVMKRLPGRGSDAA